MSILETAYGDLARGSAGPRTAATAIVRAAIAISSGGSVNGTSITVTAPADVAAGDQFILLISERDQLGTTWNSPAGWHLRHRVTHASAGEGFFYQAKYGTDITGTSWVFSTTEATVTNDKWAVAGVVLKGVGNYITSNAAQRASASTTVNSGSIDTGTKTANLVAVAGDRTTGGTTWTWPSGWIEQADVVSDTGTNSVSASCAVFDTTPTAAGVYSVTATSSQSNDDAWAGIFAFEAGGPPPVAAALSGSGSLSAGASPAVTGVASLGGGGTLAAAPAGMTQSRAADLSGSGTLTTGQLVSTTAAAALSGSGSLSTSQLLGIIRTVELSGSGQLTTSQVPGVVYAVPLSGSGTLISETLGFANAALSGSGILSTSQLLALARAAALSGQGSLTTAQQLAAAVVAALSGSGALSVPLDLVTTAALTGAGYLSTWQVNRLRLGAVQPITFRIGGALPRAIYLGNVLVWRP